MTQVNGLRLLVTASEQHFGRMVGGVLLDVDGVLTVSWHALPGAVETIGWLRERDLDFRLVTNTSSRSRRQISEFSVTPRCR